MVRELSTDGGYRSLLTALTLARKARGWSQRDLAWRMGSKQARVSRYESGELVPELPTLLGWMDVLGVGIKIMVPLGSTGQTVQVNLGKVQGSGDPDQQDPAQGS